MFIYLYSSHPSQLRGAVKYYFADFVRKWGTPPLYGKKFRQKMSYRFGGYPPPPFTKFSPKNLQKGLKIVFLQKKHLILVHK